MADNWPVITFGRIAKIDLKVDFRITANSLPVFYYIIFSLRSYLYWYTVEKMFLSLWTSVDPLVWLSALIFFFASLWIVDWRLIENPNRCTDRLEPGAGRKYPLQKFWSRHRAQFVWNRDQHRRSENHCLPCTLGSSKRSCYCIHRHSRSFRGSSLESRNNFDKTATKG